MSAVMSAGVAVAGDPAAVAELFGPAMGCRSFFCEIHSDFSEEKVFYRTFLWFLGTLDYGPAYYLY